MYKIIMETKDEVKRENPKTHFRNIEILYLVCKTYFIICIFHFEKTYSNKHEGSMSQEENMASYLKF
jgi:hypothetical protein